MSEKLDIFAGLLWRSARTNGDDDAHWVASRKGRGDHTAYDAVRGQTESHRWDAFLRSWRPHAKSPEQAVVEHMLVLRAEQLAAVSLVETA